MTLDYIAKRMNGEVRGNQVACPGPGHSSKDRSLSIKIKSSAPGGLVVYSHAGDDNLECKDFVMEKLGMEPFKPRTNGAAPQSRFVEAYDYKDASGELLYQVLRYDPKRFSHRHPDGNGGWINTGTERRVLYRLADILKYPDGTVFVCEGEKDANRVASLGYCATTVASGKWTEDCIAPLKGREVIIVEDNDEAGRKRGEAAAAALSGVAKSARIVRLPGLPPGKDVSFWLDSHSKEDFERAAFQVPEQPRGPQLMSSADFITGFTPPEYLIDGILQRRFIYAFTGRTGEGKTSVCLRLAAHVSEGKPLGEAGVTKGRVLYLAGENPDDIRMRWILLLEQMGLDEHEVSVDFVDGRFKISEIPTHILAAAAKHEYVLVIVDTSVAFSQSLDENDNVEQLRHAQALRNLIDVLPGGPTILVCCHPPKNASDDNLQPRGGGSVIAEFDGNLTCKRTDTVTVVHHQGKFRGPDFTPLHFTLEGQTAARLKDISGRQIWSVFAKPASEQDQENISRALEADLAAVMAAIREEPGLSLTGIAIRLGWLNKQRKPDKSKAQKRVKTLETKKWVEREGEQLELTQKGKDRLAKVEARKAKGTAPKSSPDLTLVNY